MVRYKAVKIGGEAYANKAHQQKSCVPSMIALSVLVGAAGGTILKAANASAQSTIPAASAAPNTSSSTNNDVSQGKKLTPNEDPAHEAKESSEREAQEDAGQFPQVH